MPKNPTDSIADFLTRIRNASRARHEIVSDHYSQLKEAIANILVKKGFVKSVAVETVEGEKNRPILVLELDLSRDPLSIKRMSKSGQRMYISAKEVKKVRSGIGIGIYSTSRGILTDSEARKARTGGEYICEIY